jgi:hypothetical protein
MIWMLTTQTEVKERRHSPASAKKMLSWINSKNLPFHTTMKRKMFLCSFKVGITDFPDLLRENLYWIIKFYCWSASSNICTHGREWKNYD